MNIPGFPIFLVTFISLKKSTESFFNLTSPPSPQKQQIFYQVLPTKLKMGIWNKSTGSKNIIRHRKRKHIIVKLIVIY